MLDWDVPCPTCERTPWETPAGQRVLRGRRVRHALLTGGPIAVVLGLALVLVVVGQLHMSSAARWQRTAADLAGVIEQGQLLRARLTQILPGSPEHQQASEAARRWAAIHVPRLLRLAGDAEQPPQVRLLAQVAFSSVLASPAMAHEVAAHREQVVAVFAPLLKDTDPRQRAVARLILEAADPGRAAIDGDSPAD